MRILSRLLSLSLLSMTGLNAASWPDPAPPTFVTAPKTPAPVPQVFDRLTFHQAPKPLNKTAKTSDWLRFLGPTDDAISPETSLLHEWPKDGPAKVWEVTKGDAYTSPAIQGDFLVLFHALADKETVECLHPETGRRYWTFDYPISYRDRYGFANGPRGSPVMAENCVVTLGVTCVLTCADLKTGHVLWKRDLSEEFHVPQEFFGHGTTPLILDGKIIINVGGKASEVPEDDSSARFEALTKPGLSVGAFDLQTGKLLWGVKDEWGASYASPIPATIHGKRVVLIYAGGESNPATGGLFCIDPVNGDVLERFAWRADEYIQATGASPVVIPEKNRVFISTAYPKGRPLGGVMLEFDEKFKAREVWSSKKFAVHWMNPVYLDGHLYGIDGETERRSYLVCFDADTGVEKWREDIKWDDLEMGNGRAVSLGIQRASLLRVDGKFLVLGELGALLWMDLSPAGAKVEARAQLFYAPHTWCLPAVSRGLLYITQNYEEQVHEKTGQRIITYDLRKP